MSEPTFPYLDLCEGKHISGGAHAGKEVCKAILYRRGCQNGAGASLTEGKK